MSMLNYLYENIGGHYDKSYDTLSHSITGYTFHLQYNSSSKLYYLTFSVCNDHRNMTSEDLKHLRQEYKIVRKIQVTQPIIVFTIKAPLSKNKFNEQLSLLLDELTSYFQKMGYKNADQISGDEGPTSVYIQNRRPLLMTDESAANIANQLINDQQIHGAIKESKLLGLTGALLGSLLGAILIVIIGQLGYVSVIGGILMGVCTLKGYELFSKKLSSFGIWCTILIILVMTFVAHIVDYSLFVARELDVDVFMVIQNFSVVFTDVIDSTQFLINLATLYFFTLVGAGGIIIRSHKEDQNKFHLIKLG